MYTVKVEVFIRQVNKRVKYILKSFKKDMDLLSEAYGSMLGGAHMGMGGLAQQAANHMRDEDGEDKTGHLSDEDLLDKVVSMGTAGVV